MAVDLVLPAEAKPVPVPSRDQQRINRGREAMKVDASKRRVCQRMERGDTYWFIDSKNQLNFQATVTKPDGSGKPSWRIRNSYNLIRPIIQGKVSTATQRTPSYQVLPSTTDMRRVSAAELAEKAALYGYDQWGVGEARRSCAQYAIGWGGEGFAYPYFDPNVGPYVEVPSEDPLEPPQIVGQGEIKILTLHGNQVYWEPGCKFAESRWWAIEDAVPKETIQEMDGYLGGELTADAATSDIPTDLKPSDQMVLLTRYFERPCPRYPNGRLLLIANGRQVVPEDSYPLKDPDGNALDEPCILRLAWDDDDGNQRDFGLTWQLIDCERTFQDCMAGDTLVQTAAGLAYARDLAGRTVDVLTADGTYRPAQWRNYGKRQLWRVTFDNGEEMYASKHHEWLVNERGAGNIGRVKTPDLVGRSVPLINRWAGMGVEDRDDWEEGVRNGLVYGDGWLMKPTKTRTQTYGCLGQYTDDGCELIERFFPGRHGERKIVKGRTQLLTKTLDPVLKQIPSREKSQDYLRGFLAGAIAADGCVNSRGAVQLYSSKRDDLERIAKLAREVGMVVNSIRRTRGGTPYKADAELFSLCFSKSAFVNEDGVDRDLVLRDIQAVMLWDSTRGGSVRMTARRVVSVEPTDRVEDTFCCEEPVTHSWVTGSGVVTGNCVNKILEWKNRCLNPQMLARVNSMLSRLDDEPGAVKYFQGAEEPKWQDPPPIPDSLFRVITMIQQVMRLIASDDQTEAQADLSNVAAKTLQQSIEQALNRWQAFIARMASWDQKLMRHCLLLCARHYTEPRLLKIKGIDGWERVQDFQGADLLGEVDVRVFPNSLVPLTRQGIRDEITWLSGMFPGWLSPQDALAAMQEGSLDRLTQSYWLDKARSNDIIQRIRNGTIDEMPTRGNIDPVTGEQILDPQTQEPMDIPGYMPDLQDNLQIWERVFSDWMKTDDFGRQEAPNQAIARQIWNAIEALKQAKAVREAALQTQMAEQAGMSNAAKPQGAKPIPSLPGSSTAPPPKQ